MMIQYNDATLNVQSVADLLQRAGRLGVGEWRPSRDGSFGTFRISRVITSPTEIQEVYAECSVPLVGLTIPDWAMDLDIEPEILRKVFDDAAETAEDEISEEGGGN